MTLLRTQFTGLTASVTLAAFGLIGATAPSAGATVSACGNNSLKVSHTTADARAPDMDDVVVASAVG